MIAENLLEEAGDYQGTRVEVDDLDADDKKEILIKTPDFNIYLKPHNGGVVQELDFKPVPYNLTNVLTRRYEGYHNKIRPLETKTGQGVAKSIHGPFASKETGLEKALIYDTYERRSLVDHFAAPDTPIDAFLSGNYMDCGSFVDADYTYKINRDNSDVLLYYNGMVSSKHVGLQKKICPAQKSSIKIVYQITNLDTLPLHTVFLSEWNILIGFGMKQQNLGMMEEFELQEDWLGLKFKMQFKPTANLYIYPVETVSLSEAGFEKNFQGLCWLPSWELKLAPRETCKIELLIDVSSLAMQPHS
ncbi:MAG: DUF1926 domain-containing protein [Deltaproteobacteria bacterium]|nr:DUF1926 domain-containing protein [Deltaproteobacteria bacterium]